MGQSANSTGHESGDSQSERSLWLAAAGAAIGAIVGYFSFFAILQNVSLYALVLVGVCIGLGRAIGAKTVSVPLGIACGLVALALSIAIEWQVAPHPDGESILNFIFHLHERPFRNVASIIIGPLIALWFGVGRRTAH